MENPQTAARLLNLDLDIISNWALDWLVDFNARETMSLLLSTKLVPFLHPQLFMNNTLISESTSYKHLGSTFSSTCSWTEHISRITESAWVRLNLIRALKYQINRKALEKIYFAFIRPLLEYNDAVWDNCSVEYKTKLESIHNEAGRIVSGAILRGMRLVQKVGRRIAENFNLKRSSPIGHKWLFIYFLFYLV